MNISASLSALRLSKAIFTINRLVIAVQSITTKLSLHNAKILSSILMPPMSLEYDCKTTYEKNIINQNINDSIMSFKKFTQKAFLVLSFLACLTGLNAQQAIDEVIKIENTPTIGLSTYEVMISRPNVVSLDQFLSRFATKATSRTPVQSVSYSAENSLATVVISNDLDEDGVIRILKNLNNQVTRIKQN